tara:strand:+ start:75 stop:302 length:228 start_codon:yes stop_codon:yes gene_type:complete
VGEVLPWDWGLGLGLGLAVELEFEFKFVPFVERVFKREAVSSMSVTEREEERDIERERWNWDDPRREFTDVGCHA